MECGVPVERTLSQLAKVKRVFCSQSHAAKFNNKGIARNKRKVKYCSKCNEGFLPDKRTRICPKCTVVCENLTIAEIVSRISAKGKHPSWRHAFIRTMNRNWNKDFPHLCQVCGYSQHVEYAHIQSVSSFPETTTLRVVNDPSNVLVLCRNHHWEFDHGFLTRDQIPDRISLGHLQGDSDPQPPA